MRVRMSHGCAHVACHAPTERTRNTPHAFCSLLPRLSFAVSRALSRVYLSGPGSALVLGLIVAPPALTVLQAVVRCCTVRQSIARCRAVSVRCEVW